MIKVIIFDLWMTLAYKDVDTPSTQKIVDTFGLSLSRKEFIKIFESSLQTKVWTSKYDAYAHLCENMDLPITDQNVNTLLSIADNAEAHAKMFDHTISMLSQLKDQGYKIGLLSNSSVFSIDYLKEKTSLLDYIDYPLFSFDVGTIKPDLKFFEAMLKKTRCEVEEVIMIGDKMDDDMLAPREIGMHSILFENYEQLKEDLSHFGIKIQ